MDGLNRDKLIYFIFGVFIALIAFKPAMAVPMIIIGLAIFGLYTLLKNLSEKELGNRPLRTGFSRRLEKSYRNSPSVPKNDNLMREICLLTGSSETAMRLVVSYRQNNPRRDERWCKEKIIYDLKRDRGAT